MNMEKTNKIAIFEEKEVRRVWHDEQWYFVIEDVVQALIESKNVKDYINKMRKRDIELDKGYGQIVHTLDDELSKGWGQIATPLLSFARRSNYVW